MDRKLLGIFLIWGSYDKDHLHCANYIFWSNFSNSKKSKTANFFLFISLSLFIYILRHLVGCLYDLLHWIYLCRSVNFVYFKLCKGSQLIVKVLIESMVCSLFVFHILYTYHIYVYMQVQYIMMQYINPVNVCHCEIATDNKLKSMRIQMISMIQ